MCCIVLTTPLTKFNAFRFYELFSCSHGYHKTFCMTDTRLAFLSMHVKGVNIPNNLPISMKERGMV